MLSSRRHCRNRTVAEKRFGESHRTAASLSQWLGIAAAGAGGFSDQTKKTDKSKENLFEYLRQSPWRLVDQVADGYFWMNEKEEILLLTQKKVMKDYWSWTASRSFSSGSCRSAKAH